MKKIEVCLTPLLFSNRQIIDNHITVIIDVLRATTSFCYAFNNGVKKIFLVESIEKSILLKNNNLKLAAERDGLKVDSADFGNSPSFFKSCFFDNDTSIIFSTTNGTMAINMAIGESREVIIASFANLSAVVAYLVKQESNIVILCSGWKGKYCIEDTLCAGAIIELLYEQKSVNINNDSALTAFRLWKAMKNNLKDSIIKSEHGQRLIDLGFKQDVVLASQLNTVNIVPKYLKSDNSLGV